MTQLALPGLVLHVEQQGTPVYSRTFGTHTFATTMPLASASKTLFCAVVMRLCDQGVLNLDDTVASYLPEWNQGQHSNVTLRHCVTHTTGLPPLHSAVSDSSSTLRQAAALLANEPLAFVPGAEFYYGNTSMHVGAAVCEVATGTAWNALFQREIAGPLGMTATDFTAFGPTQNPRVADGGVSNAPDYRNFLEMLRNDGSFAGQQILTPPSAALILSDNLGSLPVRGTPHPLGRPAGLGCWIEEKDALGRSTKISMPGLFGFYGWIDRARDSVGCWVGNQFYVVTYPYVERCWRALDPGLAPLGVRCSGTATPTCAPTPRLAATTWARAGQSDFAVAVDSLPPSAPGTVYLAFGTPTSGTPFFDTLSYVPAGSTFAAPMATDPNGQAEIPLALPANVVGASFLLQGWWLDVGGCGSAGLRASPVVAITVQP